MRKWQRMNKIRSYCPMRTSACYSYAKRPLLTSRWVDEAMFLDCDLVLPEIVSVRIGLQIPRLSLNALG